MRGALFPGQGAQSPGMGQALVEQFPESAQVFDAVSSITGRNLRELCFNTDEETLRQTQNTQIALFTTSLAAFYALGQTFDVYAGHSVGEFAALTAAGILSLEDGAKLVERRGNLMATAPEGAMSAVLMLNRETLEEICKQASTPESIVVVANDNCPGQLVISGHKDAVERAEPLVSEAKGRAKRLNVGGAFHSPLMEESAVLFREALNQAEFKDGGKVIANCLGEYPTNQSWPELLETQLKSPVRWRESMEFAFAQGCLNFVEFGSGEVLKGMFKRWNPDVTCLSANNPEQINALKS